MLLLELGWLLTLLELDWLLWSLLDALGCETVLLELDWLDEASGLVVEELASPGLVAWPL